MTETNPNLPEVGKHYLFSGEAVTVRAVKKRGRGYQVYCEGPDGFLLPVRLKDWQAGAQAA